MIFSAVKYYIKPFDRDHVKRRFNLAKDRRPEIESPDDWTIIYSEYTIIVVRLWPVSPFFPNHSYTVLCIWITFPVSKFCCIKIKSQKYKNKTKMGWKMYNLFRPWRQNVVGTSTKASFRYIIWFSDDVKSHFIANRNSLL